MGLLRDQKRFEAVIPVAQQPEPADFETKVRSKGRAFLKKFPHPNQKQFAKNSYWQECLPQLHKAYAGICAYSAAYLSMERSLDHFVPKMTDPTLAYEWSNYRLASPRVNSHKGNQSILDPFHIPPGLFVLNLTSFYVEPNVGLAPAVEADVRKTIDVLHLNTDDVLVSGRFNVVRDYAQGITPNFAFLQRYYPFIAFELQRQNQVEAIKGTFN